MAAGDGAVVQAQLPGQRAAGSGRRSRRCRAGERDPVADRPDRPAAGAAMAAGGGSPRDTAPGRSPPGRCCRAPARGRAGSCRCGSGSRRCRRRTRRRRRGPRRRRAAPPSGSVEPRRVERHGQRRRAAVRRRGRRARSAPGCPRAPDPPDRPRLDVDVEQRAAGPTCRSTTGASGDERPHVRRVGQPVRARQHRPGAAARVVGEEQRAVVLARGTCPPS